MGREKRTCLTIAKAGTRATRGAVQGANGRLEAKHARHVAHRDRLFKVLANMLLTFPKGSGETQ
jgi:hypothetical protein